MTGKKASVRRPAVELREGFANINKLDSKKQTVCAITLNSDNEILAFQRHLSKEQFQFVELVKEEENWLAQAIQAKISCDIVVISGHFGGSFFGDHGQMSLEDMETKTCSQEGNGIFHSAKEVFLFGCNTLAGKSRDGRTPQEYRRALLEHDFSESQANQIVALRYSPVGQTFADRMSRVFSGVARIYGFSSIAPSGANIQADLENYLSSQKDYASYLKTIDKSSNQKLMKSLSDTAITQVAGAVVSRNQVPRCFLQDKMVTDSAKVDWIYRVLKNPEERLNNVSEIGSYLLKSRRGGISKLQDENKISALTYDKELAAEMSKVIREGLMDYPALRLSLTNIARYFGWLSGKESEKAIYEAVGHFFEDKQISMEDMDQICSLGEAARGVVDLEMVEGTVKDTYFFGTLSCVRPEDMRLHLQVAQLLKTSSEANQRVQAARYLSLSARQNEVIYQTLLDVIKNDASLDVRSTAVLAVVHAVESNWSQDPRTREALLAVLQNDPEFYPRLNAVRAFNGTVPIDAKAMQVLLKTVKSDSSPYVRSDALVAIDSSRVKDQKPFEALYEVLRTDTDAEVRIKAIEILSKDSVSERLWPALLESLAKDAEASVRSAGAEVFEYKKPKDPKVLQFLAGVMKTEGSHYLRAKLARILGGSGTSDPVIHRALAGIVKADAAGYARGDAAEALGMLNTQDPKIHQVLVKAMKMDPEKYVRSKAVEAFQIIKPQDPKIIQAIVDMMKNDAEASPRFYAMRALGATGTRDIQVHEALVKAMTTDPDTYARSNAADALEKLRSSDSQVQEALRKYKQENP